MAINKKLIHFKTKAAFNTELNAGNILNTSIVFIQDTQEIWTHGQLYHCSLTKDEVNSLIKNSASVATLTKLLENKVDKIDGKGLSTNDFTSELMEKLESIERIGKTYNVSIKLLAPKAGEFTDATFTYDCVNLGDVFNILLYKQGISYQEGTVIDKYDEQIIVLTRNGTRYSSMIFDMNSGYFRMEDLVNLDNKVDAEAGKGLSSEDYTYEEKMKLLSVDENANNYSLPTASSTTLGGIKVGSNLSINSGVLSAAYNPATTTANGLMSTADKTKLEGIETGAQVNTITSVAGKTGAVTLAKTDVGLENVDNTSDANKPVSTAQATAIADAKKAGTDAQAAVKLEATDRANAIKALDSTVTSTDGKNVLVKVTETDGKITAVNITTDNTAKASDLTTEVTRATNAETDIQTSLLNHLKDKDRKHIPTGGQEKQILTWKSDGTAKWANLTDTFEGLEDLLAYGVEWNVNVADPHLTRIGNLTLHKTLPIQSQLKGCIAQYSKIIYWLDENDWRFRKDPTFITADLTEDMCNIKVSSVSDLAEGQYLRNGKWVCKILSIDTSDNVVKVEWETTDETDPATITQLEVGSRLDGYDGTVRVYCPSFYIKSLISGDTRRVWLSTVKIDDTWTHQPEILIDAYRSTVLNEVPKDMGFLSLLPVNSAISVVNTAYYCRGGGNRANFDLYLEGVAKDIFRTDLGKPRTDIGRTTMRTYSRNAGSEMLNYDQYKNIFYWLYVVEYANFNCQEAYNATLTAEGYHQGGMGPSITNVNSINWNGYNGLYPLTPCGYGNDLGNGTGLKTIVLPATASSAESTHYMARWRGFDNPFGDVWTNLDGIIIDTDADNHPNNMNYVYTCQDPTKYADSLNDSYEKVGEEVHQNGYTKLFDLGDAAHIIPNVMGGSDTKFKCDYHQAGSKSTSPRTLLVGGGASRGTGAGLGGFYSAFGVSYSSATFGFRSVSSFVSL